MVLVVPMLNYSRENWVMKRLDKRKIELAEI
jgi:hypothetical protein